MNSKTPADILIPKVACLCPTYGRPTVLANGVSCFLAQHYPANKLRLYVLDDAGQFVMPATYSAAAYEHHTPPSSSYAHPAPNIFLVSFANRFPSITSKYQYLLKMAKAFDPDIWLVWDDDDVYLPDYVSQHVEVHLAALQPGDDTGSVPPKFTHWSHPNPVWSDYTGKPELENSDGRFHGSLGIGKHLMRQLGGWPPTRRADFDQQMIRMCRNFAGNPLNPNVARFGSDTELIKPISQYIFRWGSTQANHCQGLMKSPDNEDWYDRYTITEPGFVGKLLPRFDEVTKRYFAQFGYEAPTSDALLGRV